MSAFGVDADRSDCDVWSEVVGRRIVSEFGGRHQTRRVEDMLDDFEKELAYCAYCPKLCRHVCPVGNAERRESVIPQAKMAMGHMARNGTVSLTEDYASVFFYCNGCGLCTEFCEHDIPVSEVLFEARAEAVARGVQPKTLQNFADRFYARNERLVRKLHGLVDEHYFVEEAQVAYMPGCDLIDDSPDDVQKTLDLFAAAGVDYVSIMESDLVCGGYPLWAAGYQSEFRHVAEEQARRLSGYRKVILACPACVYTIRHVYPKFGVNVTAEVVHVSEFLDTIAHRLPVKQTVQAAYYHDPCYLGRWLGVYEPPRRLAGLVTRKVLEFAHNREQADCCGGGGLVPDVAPQTASAIAERRLEEPNQAGVGVVVTACATCVKNLGRAGRDMEVLDIVSLLHRSLE